MISTIVPYLRSLARSPKRPRGQLSVLPILGIAVGVGSAGFAAFLIAITRLAAIEILRPKRWRLDEQWPGVPFAVESVRAGDLPASVCATERGLIVVGPRHRTAEGPVPLSPLRIGDRITRIGDTPTIPNIPPKITAAIHGRAARSAVALDVERLCPTGPERLTLTVTMPPVALDPSDLGLPFRTVRLRGQAGRTLHGWHIRPRGAGLTSVQPALIYLHGRQTNRRSIGLTDLAERAHAEGYHLLLFDLFGSGESDGEVDFWDAEEVALGRDYLAAQPDVDPGRIGVVGLSFGGYKGLLASASLREQIAATVVIAAAGAAPSYMRLVAPPLALPPFLRRRLLVGLTVPAWLTAMARPLVNTWVDLRTGRWRGDHRRFATYDPVQAAHKAHGPVLLVHGTADTTFPPAFAQTVFDALPEPKAMHWLDGMDHFNAVHAGDRLWDRIFKFLDEHLRLDRSASATATNGTHGDTDHRFMPVIVGRHGSSLSHPHQVVAVGANGHGSRTPITPSLNEAANGRGRIRPDLRVTPLATHDE